MNRPEKSPTGPDSRIIQLKPVGIIKNQSKKPSWGGPLSKLDWQERATRMKEQRDSVSELVIDSGLDGILDGIEDFSHIMVLYWAHLAPADRRPVMKVHPIGNKDFPLVGVFATHSPVRPNPILVTVVRLIERRGNVLKVTGLDALDGSPILDIKPYQPYYETEDFRVPAWMKKIHDEFTDDENMERSDGKNDGK
jgi:tRNA-Thr(GGU) m(6)t(6)A37 methyltransferase TsaA